MAAEDYFDLWAEPPDDEDQEVRCKFCGERDLWWRQTKDGWRLFDGEERPHVCRDVATAKEFE